MSHRRKNIAYRGLAVIALLVIVTACSDDPPLQADLLPVRVDPDAGEQGFCQQDDDSLVVTVENRGEAAVGRVNVQVEFLPGGASLLVDFGAVEPQQQARRAEFPIPEDCWDPDCNFRIVIDPENAVVEADETNNVRWGLCPPPEGSPVQSEEPLD